MTERAAIEHLKIIAMQRIYAASELAEMKIPGAPATPQNIKKMALREGWRFVKLSGKGGGVGYPVTALPQEWQAVILRPAILAARAQNAPAKAGKVSKAVATPTPALPHKGGGSASEPSVSADILGHFTAKQRAERAATLALTPTPASPKGFAGRGPALSHDQPSPEGYGLARGGGEQFVALPGFRVLTPAAEARADARLAVLRAFEDWLGQQNMGLGKALKGFSALYNDGNVALEGWVLAAVPTVSPNSLRNWAQKSKQDGTAALAGKYDHRKGKGVIDSNPALLDFCAAQIMHKPHLSAVRLSEAIEAEHKRVIPKRSVQSWMKGWRKANAGILQHVSNPDAHRSHRLPGFGSASHGITGMNQMWEIDATPADVMLTDGRHSVVGVIDVFTRRAMCLVTKTPRAVANTALLRRAILEWGLPEALKTDNGSDFTAKHMVRALRDLNIRHELCPPFTPQAKPHIERFFGTMTMRLFEILPGFIGHNVIDRKAIENRRAFADRLGESGGKFDIAELTADELQNYINLYLEKDYHHTIALKRGGRSPFDLWTEAQGSVKRVTDARALDLLLAPAPDGEGFRVVGKKGVSVRNYFYISPELGALVGERVHVRLDATDAGRIFCYALDGAFLCIAEAPEMTGISLRDVAMMASAAAKQAHQEGRKYVRELIKAHRPDEMAHRLLEHRVQKHASLIGFPKKAVETTTPALLSAREAADALENHGKLAEPTPLSPADRAVAAQAIAAMAAGANVRALQTTPAAGEAHFRDDISFAKWGVTRLEELADSQVEYLDEILLARGMELVFDARDIEAARTRTRARHARRHLTA